MPNVTIQILPAIAHPATQSGFLIADDVAYTEHVIGGLVFTDAETVTVLDRLFDTLRAECYRAFRECGNHQEGGRGMDWRKSSYSGANGGDCVEVADDARVVLVRDTTDRDGGTLAFTAETWQAFLGTLR